MYTERIMTKPLQYFVIGMDSISVKIKSTFFFCQAKFLKAPEVEEALWRVAGVAPLHALNQFNRAQMGCVSLSSVMVLENWSTDLFLAYTFQQHAGSMVSKC